MGRESNTSISVLYLVALCTISSVQMSASITALYAHDYLSASTVQVGIIISIFFLTGMFWRIPAGILIRGPRITKMFTLAVTLTTLSPLVYYFATNPLILMIARMIQALGFALYVPTALGIVALLTPPEKRSIAIGKYTSAGASGLMMGPVIGSIGTRLIGLQNVFLLASLDAFIGLVLVISIILPKIRQIIQEEDPPPPFHFREIPEIFSKKPVIIAFLGYFSIVFIYGTNLAFTPLYAK